MRPSTAPVPNLRAMASAACSSPPPGPARRAPRFHFATESPGNRQWPARAETEPCFAPPRIERNIRKSRRLQLPRSASRRGSRAACGPEPRRIVRKYRRQRLRDASAKSFASIVVPHAEEKMTARFQDPARFLVALHLVGKKHRAELAGHGVEASILERQRQRVRLPPRDPAVGRLPAFCMVKHWLVEIGHRHARLRGKRHAIRARQHAGARRSLQNGAWVCLRQTSGEIERKVQK